MCRSLRCSKHSAINRGTWTAEEDMILKEYVSIHGSGDWMSLPAKAGLKRCGRSCRLRWLNYLCPGIKRGNISSDEEDLILRLHRLLGNRWSMIARRLPGRTENEIKKHWIARQRKKNPLQKKSPLKPKTASNHTPVGDGLIGRHSPVKAKPIRLSKHQDYGTISKQPRDSDSSCEELLKKKICGFKHPVVENNSSPSMQTVDKIPSSLVDSPLLAQDNLLYCKQLQSVEYDILSCPYYSLEDFDFEGFLPMEGQDERFTLTGSQGIDGTNDWVDELE